MTKNTLPIFPIVNLMCTHRHKVFLPLKLSFPQMMYSDFFGYTYLLWCYHFNCQLPTDCGRCMLVASKSAMQKTYWCSNPFILKFSLFSKLCIIFILCVDFNNMHIYTFVVPQMNKMHLNAFLAYTQTHMHIFTHIYAYLPTYTWRYHNFRQLFP